MFKKKEIAIGFDRRFLSRTSAIWFTEVMIANDIKVHFVDKIAPTPLIMFTVKEMELDFGVAITASHNSYDYNGIKVFKNIIRSNVWCVKNFFTNYTYDSKM